MSRKYRGELGIGNNFSTMLDDIIKQPFAQLQKEENDLSAELQDITIKLIESKVWYSVFTLHRKR